MTEVERQRVVDYLRPRSVHITDAESDALAVIREHWAQLSPGVKLGMIAELTGGLYQDSLRR